MFLRAVRTHLPIRPDDTAASVADRCAASFPGRWSRSTLAAGRTLDDVDLERMPDALDALEGIAARIFGRDHSGTFPSR